MQSIKLCFFIVALHKELPHNGAVYIKGEEHVKLYSLFSLCAIIALCGTTFGERTIDENLVKQMNAASPEETVSALVYLEEQVDIHALSDSIAQASMRFVDRHQLVVETLQATAQSTQNSILTYLDTLAQKDTLLTVTPYWISNVIRVDARPEVILQLAKREDVLYIYLNYEIELVEPVRMGPVEQTDNRGGAEQGIIAIRATEAWDMGFTGDGVLVATLDTGVDGGHEALASRWAGNTNQMIWGCPSKPTTAIMVRKLINCARTKPVAKPT